MKTPLENSRALWNRMRARIRQIVLTVPLPMPRFWLAALASLGEPVDWNTPLPDYFESTGV